MKKIKQLTSVILLVSSLSITTSGFAKSVDPVTTESNSAVIKALSDETISQNQIDQLLKEQKDFEKKQEVQKNEGNSKSAPISTQGIDFKILFSKFSNQEKTKTNCKADLYLYNIGTSSWDLVTGKIKVYTETKRGSGNYVLTGSIPVTESKIAPSLLGRLAKSVSVPHYGSRVFFKAELAGYDKGKLVGSLKDAYAYFD
ncbi:hypothetical protein [Aneurinibacillus danicus]|uniref:DUF4352 domain-containing protein n=1 Tax=Aneurinibacillus danicus TaxID=267746 RepID=A0A511V9X9_9BACL|nr:hypothetical protein [Aneurinibacillus danicus]GEN35727.1 hypothetical protein ADA01nite_31870 [Aneurinibacillus danicus]